MHFIGYSPQSKAYRLYNPTSGKVIININVVFQEEASWEWNGEKEDLGSEKEDLGIHIPVQSEAEHTTNQLGYDPPLLPTVILIILLMAVATTMLFQQAPTFHIQRHLAKRHQ